MQSISPGRFAAAAVLREERGFSLAELLVTSLIMLAVLATVTQVFVSSNTVYRDQSQYIEARDNASAATDMLARLIRSAGANRPLNAVAVDPDPDGNHVLDTIRLVADWNPVDGTLNGRYEDVTFSVAGNTLLKFEPAFDAAPVPFADRIASVGFAYTNASGAPLPMPIDAGQVAFVVVTVATTPVDGRPGRTLRTSASIRRTE